MRQTTHAVTQCDTATGNVVEQDIFTQQCLGRSRWQTTGSPGCDCHHRHKCTENDIHTGVFPLCLSELCAMEENVSMQGKSVCPLPIGGFPSLTSSHPLVLMLSGQVLHICIYVMLLRHIYILLENLTSKISGETCCLGSDTEQVLHKCDKDTAE